MCFSIWRKREPREERTPTTTLQGKRCRLHNKFLFRWKRRHSVGVRCGTNSSQMVPADHAELIQELRASVIRIQKAKDISLSYIINMDQTMCRFDMPSTRTNDAVVPFESRRPRLRRRALLWPRNFPLSSSSRSATGFSVKGSRKDWAFHPMLESNGWMTATEYRRWLVTVLKRDDHRRLLIVDSYSPEDNIKTANDRCNADVLIIPGGCTSIVQPMDKCINKPFKESTRASWQAWRESTKAGNLKQPTRQDAINWVGCQKLGDLSLVHSFLVCRLSNALDGSQYDLVSCECWWNRASWGRRHGDWRRCRWPRTKRRKVTAKNYLSSLSYTGLIHSCHNFYMCACACTLLWLS